MANITIAGIEVDTEDIDLLVKYCPLAELDRLIQADKEIMAQLTDPREISYWEHRSESHRMARDIAENMWNNGQISKYTLLEWDRLLDIDEMRRHVYPLLPKVTQLLDYCHALEGNLTSLRETLKEHVNEKKVNVSKKYVIHE